MFKKLILTLTVSFGILAGPAQSFAQKLEVATFAGGCFWCIESDFDHVPGVVKTVSGYTGGHAGEKGDNATYKTYIKKGHTEGLQITFDPSKTSYKKLLDVFWHSVDPTDAGGQFCDRGPGYTTGVFTNSAKQAAIAKASKAALIKANPDKKIITQIFKAGRFFDAESHHQGYAARNPIRYNYYRRGCGRDKRVRQVWGKEAHRGITAH